MKGRKKKNTTENLIWEMAYRKMSQTLPDSVIENWIDHLYVLKNDGNKVVLEFKGQGRPSFYEDKYGRVLEECLEWAAGHSVEVEYTFATVPFTSHKSRKKEISRGLKVFCIAALALVILVGFTVGENVLINRNFMENFYQVPSGKVERTLRVIQLSDLHNSSYGDNNAELVRRIELLKPDIIVMTGDMVEKSDVSADIILNLCKELVETAPVYYIYGNNEKSRFMSMEDKDWEEMDELFTLSTQEERLEVLKEMDGGFREQLEAVGVVVLWNEMTSLDIDGMKVDIFGTFTTEPETFWNYVGQEYEQFLYDNTDRFKLLLCHEPYIFETYGDGGWADLALCGQTHGGVVRLPKLGGVYEQKNGFFPEMKGAFVYGEYNLQKCSLIVSSGLTNRGIPRINNQPELVVVDISRY